MPVETVQFQIFGSQVLCPAADDVVQIARDETFLRLLEGTLQISCAVIFIEIFLMPADNHLKCVVQLFAVDRLEEIVDNTMAERVVDVFKMLIAAHDNKVCVNAKRLRSGNKLKAIENRDADVGYDDLRQQILNFLERFRTGMRQANQLKIKSIPVDQTDEQSAHIDFVVTD